jgi:hypothetical protein
MKLIVDDIPKDTLPIVGKYEESLIKRSKTLPPLLPVYKNGKPAPLYAPPSSKRARCRSI